VAYPFEEINAATLVGGGVAMFKDVYDRVNIDEKWFYQTSDGKNYILTAAEFDEDDDDGNEDKNELVPHRTTLTQYSNSQGGNTRIQTANQQQIGRPKLGGK
jgi:hypothetical protein